MATSMPDLSPLMADALVCHKCGEFMKRKVVKGPRGVKCIEYSCTNKKTGCSYKVESYTMISSQMIGIREDGSEIR